MKNTTTKIRKAKTINRVSKEIKEVEGSFKDFASGKVFTNPKEFLLFKGIGLNKGTKYEILLSYLVNKLSTKPNRVEVISKSLFKFSEGSKLNIRDSIKNSNYLSPKFLPEVIRVLGLKGIYTYKEEVIREVDKDNFKGKTSGLISFILEKIKK